MAFIVFINVKMYVVEKNERVKHVEPSQVEEIFARMYTTCGVNNDYQLAQYLGVKASSVKGWKIAKHPPFKACFQIYQQTGVTVEWLITGNEPYVRSTTHHVAERDGVYDVDTQQAHQPKQPISMPLENFQLLFREAIIDGISSQFFDLLPGTDKRAIDALAARFYRKVNDPVVLPDEAENTESPSELG